eukprot:c27304_g1_i1 orf=257-3433(+)
MLGNGVVGIQREEYSKWERRAPVTPSHCAQLLQSHGVRRIIVQPCTKRVYHDLQYQNGGCQISDDLSECGLILGVKQPKLGTVLPDTAYAFFSHTHKAEPQNMPILDEVLAKRVSLYDYELIVGERGERLVAFGEYAGMAGMIDFLRGLGERYLSLGYSTPFLSLGSTYMYMSLSAAKAAIIAVGDEIRSTGLPSAICPLTFVFTGSGNVSRGAQEIFRLLPHSFVSPCELPQLTQLFSGGQVKGFSDGLRRRGNFQVYGCVVTSENMVVHNDPAKSFDKDNYYAHPGQYHSVFHENIAPYASVIVNCIYWEKRFPRLLTNEQLQKLMLKDKDSIGNTTRPLIGIADITCDLGGSIECVNQTTSIEKPFLRYDPLSDSYHNDMNGDGIIILAVDNLPTELAKEATNHFGDVLFCFLHSMAYARYLEDLLMPIRRACIAQKGQLTSLYEYIQRMRQSETSEITMLSQVDGRMGKQCTTLVSLNGHLFDQFLINEALDTIEEAGGRFHLATCELGQTVDAMSYAELEVTANSEEELAHILDLLAAVASHSGKGSGEIKTSLSKPSEKSSFSSLEKTSIDITAFKTKEDFSHHGILHVLILGAGRMCEPAVKYLACNAFDLDQSMIRNSLKPVEEAQHDRNVWITVASLFIQDAQKASVVISLLPASFHMMVANSCIEMGTHLVTASYVTQEMSALDDKAKSAGITILCEMGLDPGIDHMMAMKMIDMAHSKGGSIHSFVSYCGGLPSPAAANNPLGYKFSWNPAGALNSGRNPAIYKSNGQTIEVSGEDLFSSAIPFRLPNFPAFALERLPNRNSLMYGELYGISNEASTIFRATLRYEGFSKIMNCLAKLGYFSTVVHPMLKENESSSPKGPSYHMLLENLITKQSRNDRILHKDSSSLAERLTGIECCDEITAKNVAICISLLGLDLEDEIPIACQCAFDVLCSRMENKLLFSSNEQDMVLLHHELKILYQDGRQAERHSATLLEFGDSKYHEDSLRRPQSAMARTVGLPAAIGAQLLLLGKIQTRGVLRPLSPEIYLPVLEILEASGLQVDENIQYL